MTSGFSSTSSTDRAYVTLSRRLGLFSSPRSRRIKLDQMSLSADKSEKEIDLEIESKELRISSDKLIA